MSGAQLVQKLWNYCNILRDDGLSYGDYVEQLTFLLFLKMADRGPRDADELCAGLTDGVSYQRIWRNDP